MLIVARISFLTNLRALEMSVLPHFSKAKQAFQGEKKSEPALRKWNVLIGLGKNFGSYHSHQKKGKKMLFRPELNRSNL